MTDVQRVWCWENGVAWLVAANDLGLVGSPQLTESERDNWTTVGKARMAELGDWYRANPNAAARACITAYEVWGPE